MLRVVFAEDNYLVREGTGRNTVAIRASLSKHTTLRPGRYTLTITATNRFGTSAKERLRLRVVR
jgi:hypothetical protein